MTDAPAAEDPISYVSPDFFTPDDGSTWAEKHWLNVPGPFYTGRTDNCWTGRQSAPRHVLYGGEHYNEFVYRQPKTRAEVECLLSAAEDDPFDGYACDGDSRWKPDAVRAWWAERGQVEDHVATLVSTWTAGTNSHELEAAEGARDFLAYLAGDLRTDLQAYIFRLEQGRNPDTGEQLPDLTTPGSR
ncbi:hypothetical protein VSH64_31180 [Amycolatopsis rhabdoformis]|uniref:Ferredoxin n=1 Tax=Amycolatopsis rhabdoformis TaxID=1448059 RepID=A0ABZ1I0I0_9PSEU|nr:hypothetical protein [Amycolatopsis rhabdoformis]WSE27311.1 hypothetical protein VSH64_31180 [Amycolatopsis rhabdoformis]